MDNIGLIKPKWSAPTNVKAFSTTRVGGFSQGAYQSLNLGLHVGDESEKVLKNRALLPNSNTITWLNQTHSAHAVELLEPSTHPLKADASFTSVPGQTCAVMTADCLPILLCHSDGTEVAAIHAGWRGLAAGVVENTLAKMNSKTEKLMAWLGPAISAESFEVGHDVFCQFTHDEKKAFSKGLKSGKYWLDLHELAAHKLSVSGVRSITRENRCTYINKEFFSYRRDKATGRMASCIWIEN